MGTYCSIALSQTGSALAKPFTSFLVLVSKSPFMKDIAPSRFEGTASQIQRQLTLLQFLQITQY